MNRLKKNNNLSCVTSATRDDNKAIDSGADALPWQQLGWRKPHGSGLLCMRSRLNNREPSSPWRSITRSVVHLRISSGPRVRAESVLWTCGTGRDFSSCTELGNNGSFDTESVITSCLGGQKNQPLLLNFIP